MSKEFRGVRGKTEYVNKATIGLEIRHDNLDNLARTATGDKKI